MSGTPITMIGADDMRGLIAATAATAAAAAVDGRRRWW
jgi:hypothetical protein